MVFSSVPLNSDIDFSIFKKKLTLIISDDHLTLNQVCENLDKNFHFFNKTCK